MARNPYINKYKHRLTARQSDRERRQTLDTVGKVSGALAVGVGALAAGHAITPGGIYNLADEASTRIRAIKKGIDKSDIGRRINREAKNFLDGKDVNVKSTLGEVQQRFTEGYSKVVKESHLENRALDLTQKLKHGRSTIGGIKTSLNRRELHKKVMSDLDGVIDSMDSSGKKQMQELKARVEQKVAPMTRMVNRNPGRLRAQLSKLEDDFSEDVVGNLNTVLKRNAEDISSVKGKQVGKKTGELEGLLTDELAKRGKEGPGVIKSALNKVLGYRQATAEDVLDAHKKGNLSVQESTRKFLDRLKKDKNVDLSSYYPDRNLYVKGGELVNTHSVSEFTDSLKDEFSQGLLGRLFRLQDRMHYEKYGSKNPIKILKAGRPQPVLSDLDVTDERGILQDTLIGVGDSVYGLDDLSKPLRTGMQFTSGRFGMTQRMLTQMSGNNAPEWGEEGQNFLQEQLSKLSKGLDIHEREDPNVYDRAKSFLTKFSNDNWTRNEIQNTLSPSTPVTYEDIYNVREYLESYSKPFSDNLLRQFRNEMGFGKLSFDTNEETVQTFQKIINRTNPSIKGKSEIQYAFENHLPRLLERTRMVQHPQMLKHNEVLTGVDLIQREASKFLVGEMGETTSLKFMRKLYDEGKISKTEYKEGKTAVASYIFDEVQKGDIPSHGFDIHDIDPDKIDANSVSSRRLKKFSGLFSNPKVNSERAIAFRGILDEMSKKTHPWHSQGPVEGFKGTAKGDILAINKINWEKLNVMKGNFDFKYAGELAKGIFTHGRKTRFTKDSMDKVNYADLTAYSLASRLNDLLKSFSTVPFGKSLGLSDKSTGTTGSILSNLYLKRIMPAYGAVEGLKYLNDHSASLFGGYTAEQKYQRGKAKTRLATASIKDNLGITKGLKWLDSVTPGSENLTTALHDIPVAGWAAEWTGATSTKSRKDWVEYYKHGQKEIREGRYWILGNQPWMGKGVDHHEPNDYKQAMSEWEYTDTVYGSKENYWSHSWLPTPTNPLAPIRRFITDPYWFEEMHKKDRPYPISGALFDPNTPHGAILNSTVGQILKPPKDYDAGATKKDLERQRQREDFKLSYSVGKYSAGRVSFQNFVPKEKLTNKYLDMASGSKGAQKLLADQNKIAKAKAKSGSLRGIINTSDTTVRGKVASQQQLQAINEQYKQQAKVGGRYNGKSMSEDRIRAINQAIKDKAKSAQSRRSIPKDFIAVGVDSKKRQEYGYLVNNVPSMHTPDRAVEASDPTSIGYRIKKMGYLFKDVLGAHGFLLGFGGAKAGQGEKTIARADMAYAGSNRFWEMTPGGRGAALSEFGRRILNHPRNRMQRVNHLKNMMPNWLPGSDYFKNFQEGDPYTKVKRGEIRLPGAAYESLNALHPDKYGKYGAVDRAAILQDVAPYSQEAEFWTQIAQNQKLTKKEKAFLKRAKQRAKEQKKDYFITPYKFKGEVNSKDAKIRKFVGPNRFMIEGSDKVYRFAGVKRFSLKGKTKTSQKLVKTLRKKMAPGSEVEIMTSKGAKNKQKGSIPAVVTSGDINVNRALLNKGAKGKKEDSVIGTYVNHTPIGRTIGKTWETIAHGAKVPYVHSKFLAVRSPMEHLRQRNIYDKNYKDWNEPVEDFVKPAFRSSWAENPVWGSIKAGTFTAFFGSIFLDTRHAAKLFTAGATVGGAGSIARIGYEISSGKAWIPKSEEKVRDINKYFDRLKYIKNKRLYNKYKKLAKEREGVDLEKVIKTLKKKEKKVRQKQRKAANIKDYLEKNSSGQIGSIQVSKGKGLLTGKKQRRIKYAPKSSKEYAKYRSKQINKDIRKAKNREVLMRLGKYSRQAIKHRRKYKSTLFAVNENNVDFKKIYRALPNKDKDYFKYFAQETDPEKREEILKIVSDDQARMYKAIWGKDYEEHTKEDLKQFFKKHRLPNKDWVGWKEGVSLEDSKIKVIQNEGMDLDTFGIWKDYTEDEKLTPAPTQPGMSFDTGTPNIEGQLQSVLSEFDIEDLNIQIEPTNSQDIEVSLDVEYDLADRVKEGVATVLAS